MEGFIITEEKMETTIVDYLGFRVIRVIMEGFIIMEKKWQLL